jgi:hypothetical protein
MRNIKNGAVTDSRPGQSRVNISRDRTARGAVEGLTGAAGRLTRSFRYLCCLRPAGQLDEWAPVIGSPQANTTPDRAQIYKPPDGFKFDIKKIESSSHSMKLADQYSDTAAKRALF